MRNRGPRITKMELLSNEEHKRKNQHQESLSWDDMTMVKFHHIGKKMKRKLINLKRIIVENKTQEQKH